ncbi:MAG TPA: hypothetical protein VHO02_03240 [Fibrobacteria bacterium]|nr:hypothetical protein [Fibrobacteria bacterium]
MKPLRAFRMLPAPMFLAPLLLPIVASAFCGLQSCPRPASHGEMSTLEAGLRTRWVAYDIAGNEGSYLVTAPRLFVRYWGVALGAEIPFTRLQAGTETTSGLSNPILMAQYARRFSATWSGEVGMQVELPVGDEKDGLAGDHLMLLPWVGARKDLGTRWYVSGMLGASRAIETKHEDEDVASLAKVAHEGHEHGESATATPVIVNPHADREIQWRAATGWTRGRSTLEGFTLAQHDVTGEAGPDFYLRAGASWEWAIGNMSALQLIGDLPVTAARRNEAEIGLALRTGW